MSSIKRPSQVPMNNDLASKVLDFIGRAARPFASIVAGVDRSKAAQVIQMPMRRGVAKAAEDKPPVAVVSRVAECVDKLFPTLRGAVRQQMVEAISRKISEDPHVRSLIG